MKLKKYFFGVLLLISYLGLINIFENISRLIVNGFKLDIAITAYIIILILFYIIILFAILFFVKKEIEFNKHFLLLIIITIVIKGIQISTNYYLSTITWGTYFENSLEFFKNERIIGSTINILLFIFLSIYFSIKKLNN